jgi:hypothetical protein
MSEFYHREMRISPTVLPLPEDRPGAAPWAVQEAALGALRRLYADAHALGAQVDVYGHVDEFVLTFKPEGRLGEHLVAVDANVSERRVRMSAAQIEAGIMQALATRRRGDDG